MSDLFGGTMPTPLAAQVREVERELTLRRRVYPRRVAAGNMTKLTAERQTAVMEAVLATLHAALDAEAAGRPDGTFKGRPGDAEPR